MMAHLADIIAAAADDREAQRAAVRAELERLADPDSVVGFSSSVQYADSVRPNAWEATTADDLFNALERDGYTEGW